jgi:hypothetical protein
MIIRDDTFLKIENRNIIPGHESGMPQRFKKKNQFFY